MNRFEVLGNGGEYEVIDLPNRGRLCGYRRPSSVSFVRSLEEDLMS